MLSVVQSLKYLMQGIIPDEERSQSEHIIEKIICNKLVGLKGAGARSTLETC